MTSKPLHLEHGQGGGTGGGWEAALADEIIEILLFGFQQGVEELFFWGIKGEYFGDG